MKISTKPFRFQCPHCERFIKARASYAGRSANCPGCQANLVVPFPDESDPSHAKSVPPKPETTAPPGPTKPRSKVVKIHNSES